MTVESFELKSASISTSNDKHSTLLISSGNILSICVFQLTFPHIPSKISLRELNRAQLVVVVVTLYRWPARRTDVGRSARFNDRRKDRVITSARVLFNSELMQSAADCPRRHRFINPHFSRPRRPTKKSARARADIHQTGKRAASYQIAR